MTTNQLKYFITAAETLSFTEAGKLHYISQTAITQHIQALKEQLGVKLFAREKSGCTLHPPERSSIWKQKRSWREARSL